MKHNPYASLIPGYPGECRGHIVTRQISSKTKVAMIPRKENREIVDWMPIKRNEKVCVTFIWTGTEWKVHKVG